LKHEGRFHYDRSVLLPRKKIVPIQKIAVVGVNFSPTSNGGAIFLQTVIVNKSPGGEFFMLGVHKKIAPLC